MAKATNSERDALIVRMWHEGAPAVEIGNALGISRMGAFYHVARLGLQRRDRVQISNPVRAELTRLWHEGETVQAIADRLGLKHSHVSTVARADGLPPRRASSTGSAERHRELARLWGEGVPAAEIAERLGLAVSSVVSIRMRLQLPPRKTKYTAEQLDAIRQRWAEGVPAAEIADQIGRSREGVLSASLRLGLEPRGTGWRRGEFPSECTLPDCSAPHHARGLCGRHYQAALRAEKRAA
ncbi:hypothetical protein [Microbacterium murale]|uniref:GcrA cell cycle regulator n=1 Tax=Microbacterium murale TaxID=1081040 RepID=A0ABU0PG70_9MICO|nr:hypothetical protein [Microbacterium murale]MDQ0645654.1 hypothetical protein [Microbacterium murale]